MSDLTYDGRNGAACRDWMREHAGMPEGESWFLTKGMSAATGGQAWRYAAHRAGWPDSIKAAVYAPGLGGSWVAVPSGATLHLAADGSCWLAIEHESGSGRLRRDVVRLTSTPTTKTDWSDLSLTEHRP